MYAGSPEPEDEVGADGKKTGKKKMKGLFGEDIVQAGTTTTTDKNGKPRFYEPMGYHTGGSGRWLHGGIWGTQEMRQHIWEYCPEVKMTLAMDAAQYVPGECNDIWKRDGGAEPYGVMGEAEEWPALPEGLVPW